MPNDEQQREVAAFFKVNGWEPGQMCKHCDNYEFWGPGAISTHRYHEVPPPDLTLPQNAWALLMAIEARGLIIMFDGAIGDVHILAGDGDILGGDDTLRGPAALITAAYQTIPDKKESRHD